jgi:hypothetical protein
MVDLPKNRRGILKQDGGIRRLKAMRTHLPSFITAAARPLAMVLLAIVLILVLLPLMLSANAASMG